MATGAFLASQAERQVHKAAIRKEEKVIWVACVASGFITPASVLFPRISGVVPVARTGLSCVAFLAAVALLVSIWDERVNKQAG